MDFGQPLSLRETSVDDDGPGIPGADPVSSSSVAVMSSPSPKTDRLNLWGRLKRLIVHHVLQLDGSPHSIALGVFIGFVIGMTPTIGLQMISYVAIAAMTGANRLSGFLPIWTSNPITAVPLYYFNWRVGVFVMTGQLDAGGTSRDELAALIANAPGQDMPLLERITSADFWNLLFDLFVALGVELWVGCIVVGVVFGVLGYWATYRGVKAYRRRQPAA